MHAIKVTVGALVSQEAIRLGKSFFNNGYYILNKPKWLFKATLFFVLSKFYPQHRALAHNTEIKSHISKSNIPFYNQDPSYLRDMTGRWDVAASISFLYFDTQTKVSTKEPLKAPPTPQVERRISMLGCLAGLYVYKITHFSWKSNIAPSYKFKAVVSGT